MCPLAALAGVLFAAAGAACVREAPEWGTAAVVASDDHPAPPPGPPAPKADPDGEAAARATLAELEKALAAREWAKVRAGIEGFERKHPKAGGMVVEDLAALAQRFHTQRLAWFSTGAGKSLVPVARRLVSARVRAKGARIDDVLAWLRKDLPDEAVAALAKELAAEDAAVTVEETRSFWDARPKPKDVWTEASYGNGSFLVAAQRRRGAPSRDLWWERAEAPVREGWVLAAFVEASGLFDVAPRGEVPCAPCGGTGVIRKPTKGGGVLEYVCPRCNGAGCELVVKFR